MKYLKKIVSVTSIATLLIASWVTTNAAINGTTATYSDITIGSTITITDIGSSFSDTNEINTAKITLLDGSSVSANLTANGANGSDTTSTLTIAWADLSDDTSYTIIFTTVEWDFGSTTLRLWDSTNDSINVTATVEPVLKFALENTNQDLWVLSTTANSVTTWVEVWTNAVGWISVTAKSVNGWLNSVDASHTINLSTNEALYNAEDYTFASSLWISDWDSTATPSWASSTSINTANQTLTIYSTDKPQNFSVSDYDADFTISAQIAESTPAASDYNDVIIFTATANF